jgi:signal transduction histidine kinase
MRRLYLQIYLAIVAILLLFSVLATLAWFAVSDDPLDRATLAGLGALAGDVLPAPDRPQQAQLAALSRLASQLGADLALRGPDGSLVAAVGRPLPLPPSEGLQPGRLQRRGPFVGVLPLPDGRWLLAQPRRRARRGWHVLGALGLLAGAVALGAYPVVRRLTGRLERLRGRVDDLGAGDLSARVEVEGRDEVADLARSFNRAAERIDRLVAAQRTLLASVSHELRTPLTRIRLAAELLGGGDRPELRERIERDIEILDELIGELLLASRLDAHAGIDARESVDLLALVAEEAAPFEAEVSGEQTRVRGEPRLLRHLVHNLLENARRHAGGSDVCIEVSTLDPEGARLRVSDRGPGIAAEEREAIFEPFYQPSSRPAGSDRGVGLGLALVRRIARLHGGNASCHEPEGGGVCFEVTLQPPAVEG